ncbi:unnamed protein product [Nezara viridula]|uniref:Uncharacterized protein n=1 Tax=Nezara viridula TaxID=85310 RepID=A0A9P0H8L1_NEZVI|nr:unnamed protein product [Nezara viridula]
MVLAMEGRRGGHLRLEVTVAGSWDEDLPRDISPTPGKSPIRAFFIPSYLEGYADTGDIADVVPRLVAVGVEQLARADRVEVARIRPRTAQKSSSQKESDCEVINIGTDVGRTLDQLNEEVLATGKTWMVLEPGILNENEGGCIVNLEKMEMIAAALVQNGSSLKVFDELQLDVFFQEVVIPKINEILKRYIPAVEKKLQNNCEALRRFDKNIDLSQF